MQPVTFLLIAAEVTRLGARPMALAGLLTSAATVALGAIES